LKWLKIVATLLSAAGTIAVAVVAIWGDLIRRKLAGPRVSLGIRSDLPDMTQRNDGTRTAYFQLQLRNRRSWSPARSARVLITSLSKRLPSGDYGIEPLVYPVQLHWTPPSFRPLVADVRSEDVCDLGSLDEGAKAFRLATYAPPNNFSGFVAAGESIRVSIIVEGENYQSKVPLEVEVSWDGQWASNPLELQRHLVVRENKPAGQEPLGS